MARGATGVVVNARHDQAGFESCNVERLHPRNAQGVVLARLDQGIPDGERLLERHPEFVAKVAGVAGARDPYRCATDRHIGATEEGEVGHVAANGAGEHVACVRPLQREGAELLRHIFNGDVQALACRFKPAVLRLRGGPEVGAVGEERHGAVIKDAAVVIAPWCVDGAHRLDAINTTGDDAINELRRIWSGDAVLAHWGDVEERRGEADRMVFQVVRWEI